MNTTNKRKNTEEKTRQDEIKLVFYSIGFIILILMFIFIIMKYSKVTIRDAPPEQIAPVFTITTFDKTSTNGNKDVYTTTTTTEITVAIIDSVVSNTKTSTIVTNYEISSTTIEVKFKNSIDETAFESIYTETYTTSNTENVVELINYNENDLYLLSHLINAEGGNQSWDFMIATGSVALNRVSDDRFGNSLYDVIYQNGQYECILDGNFDKSPTDESVEAAKYLLTYGSQIPSYVIFQSEFLQGDSLYTQIGNTYFCYYAEDVK